MAPAATLCELGGSNPDMTASILTPIGTASVDHLASNANTSVDGTTRLSHSSGATGISASSIVSIQATEVDVPGAAFTSSGLALAGTMAVSGATTFSNLGLTSMTSTSGVTTNTINSTHPADTLAVTAGKVVLAADVQVTGPVEKLSSSSMSIVDTVLEIGAVSNAGVAVTSVADAARDGAGIVVPGPPQYLPTGATAATYAHAVKWKVNSGDFNANGTAVAPQSQPFWEFQGGSVSIAAPDASSRVARFLLSPTFTGSTASLGLYYAVGNTVTLMQSFSTAAFS